MNRPVQFTTCTIPNCARPHEAHGLCREHYIREHWGNGIRDGLVECGWLSKEMIAVLDALFAHGPLKKLPKGWVGHNVVLSVQSAKGLVRRGLAEIKGKYPHERLYVTRAGDDLAGRINGAPINRRATIALIQLTRD
jgi:hypothetical protein